MSTTTDIKQQGLPFDISLLVTQASILPKSSSSSFQTSNIEPANSSYSHSSNSSNLQSYAISSNDVIIVEETTTTDVDNTVVATIASNNGPCGLLVEGVAVEDEQDEVQEVISEGKKEGSFRKTPNNDVETISTMTTMKSTSTTKKIVKRHSSLSGNLMNQVVSDAANNTNISNQTSDEQYTTLQSTPKRKKSKSGSTGKNNSLLGSIFKSVKTYLTNIKKKSKSRNNSNASASDQNTSVISNNSQALNTSTEFNPSILVTQAPNPKNTSSHSISTSTQSERVGDDAEIIRTTTTMTTTVRRRSIDLGNQSQTSANKSTDSIQQEQEQVEVEEELSCTTTTVTTKKRRLKPSLTNEETQDLSDNSSPNKAKKLLQKNTKLTQDKPSLLAPQRSHVQGRKTLVLDLDETLVHSVFVHTDQADFVIPIEMDGRVYSCYVLKRPGVDEFLREMGKYFEIVIFTASLSLYANPLLDILDKHGVVEGRLFREHCTKVGDTYIKDLSKLGRDLDQTLIVDNSPSCYALHPQNALAASTWYDDISDRELYLLADCLTRLEKERTIYDGLRSWKELISSGSGNSVNVASASCGGSTVTVSSMSHHHKVIKKRL